MVNVNDDEENFNEEINLQNDKCDDRHWLRWGWLANMMKIN